MNESDVDVEVEYLKEHLPSIRVHLLERIGKCKDEANKEMELNLRNSIYDIEDIIEMSTAKKRAGKVVKFSDKKMKKMKNLRATVVQPIAEKYNKDYIALKDSGPQSSSEHTRSEPTVVEVEGPSDYEEDIVEFDEQKTLLKYLMEPKEELDIISISGMPGIGKTTLVNSVFQDARVADKFPLRLWIRFSNEKQMMKEICNALNICAPPLNVGECMNTICKALVYKDFLIVLEDVWSVDDLKSAKKIFPFKNRNGKVIITSRNEDIALAFFPLPNREINMNLLDDSMSYQLLMHKVFPQDKKLPDYVHEAAYDIVKKCGGSPLAILVVASILKRVNQKEGVSRVSWNILKDNISFDVKSIMEAVDLSYNRLSAELKPCLLYMGMFPENHVIRASRLILLWKAEGFIQDELTGHKYIKDLIRNNLLTIAKKSPRHVKSCKVHDMVREFCRIQAKKENMLLVIGEDMERGIRLSATRRICLESNLSTVDAEAKVVRSFHCLFEAEEGHISTIIETFKLLRVLNCPHIIFQKFPSVKKNVLLKHIVLSIGDRDVLPKEISKLVNLQHLIVETSSRTLRVQNNIWKMKELEVFETKAALILKKNKKKKAKAKVAGILESISRLSPESCTQPLIDRAPKLKKLGIRGNFDNLFDTFPVESFLLLENLKLFSESTSPDPRSRLPKEDCFPQRLKRMTLSETYLEWEIHIPILAKISTLEVLKLKSNSFKGSTWDLECEFRNLHFFLIEHLDLRTWNLSPGSFPILKWLEIRDCENLLEIPIELEWVECLEKLEIQHLMASAAESARRIEDRKRVTEEKWAEHGKVPFKLVVDE